MQCETFKGKCKRIEFKVVEYLHIHDKSQKNNTASRIVIQNRKIHLSGAALKLN